MDYFRRQSLTYGALGSTGAAAMSAFTPRASSETTINASASLPQASQDNAPPSERFQRGWQALQAIDGKAGEQVIASLETVAPDLARYVIEFAFGDIYARPGLDLKSREIATVAALTAMGNASPQLKVHLQAALNVGCTREEVVEVVMQMAVYAGFPAALNGITALKEVLEL